MVITLTLDDEVVARARELAEGRQQTLDALVAAMVRERCAASVAAEWAQFTAEHAGCSEPGWRFERAACYERTAP
jgi:predicted transcriptional regulator